MGAQPNPTEDLSKRLVQTPSVLFRGVDESFARAGQRLLLAELGVTEVRSIEEDNFDLLHRSGTPGTMFVGGLLLGWAAVCAIGWAVLGTLGICLAFLAGPPVGWLFQKRAHLFLSPAFVLATAPALPAARQLAEAYRDFLVLVYFVGFIH